MVGLQEFSSTYIYMHVDKFFFFCIKSISVVGANWIDRPNTTSMVHEISHSQLVKFFGPDLSPHVYHEGFYMVLYMYCIIRMRFYM